MDKLIQEKVNQAIGIMQELDIDMWLTFVRETIENNDPAMHFVAGTNIVWQAAFIITKSGETVAITGKGDHGNIERLGVYKEVIPYTESVKGDLLKILDRYKPKQIAINFSQDNVSADGLSHGMYLRLNNYLAETPYKERLISADELYSKVRGRKTKEEIRRIQKAVDYTIDLFDQLTKDVKVGWTEKEISNYMHQKMGELDLEASWDYEYDPGVNCGVESLGGHMPPGDIELKKGDVLHLDFGVKYEGYSSDLQRIWYVLDEDETSVPEEIQKAFKVVQLGIQRAAKAIKPGVICYKIDQIARDTLKEYGYPEYEHALGHQVGIWAHDGGSILGPRWERYGSRPLQKIEENQVYTLEFGIKTSKGYVSQEENILITKDGCKFLAKPQKEIWLIK
ncbi:MAG: M24 family metallopeptidase [Clostridia bacterium]